MGDISIRQADKRELRSDRLFRLADLINAVYAESEAPFWKGDYQRTSREGLKGIIMAGRLIIAEQGKKIVGVIRVQRLQQDLAEFGLLATDPLKRGVGIGRQLVNAAERWAAEKGIATMQLELLLSTAWDHPPKTFLKEWYTRKGYELLRIADFTAMYPEEAPHLATPSVLEIYHKAL